MNTASILLEIHMEELGLKFTPEFQFAKPRKWRFDYIIDDFLQSDGTWLNGGLWAIEIEGGIFMRKGRHTSGVGYQKDLEKYREATIRGYKLLRFSTQEVLKGVARQFLKDHVAK